MIHSFLFFFFLTFSAHLYQNPYCVFFLEVPLAIPPRSVRNAMLLSKNAVTATTLCGRERLPRAILHTGMLIANLHILIVTSFEHLCSQAPLFGLQAAAH